MDYRMILPRVLPLCSATITATDKPSKKLSFHCIFHSISVLGNYLKEFDSRFRWRTLSACLSAVTHDRLRLQTSGSCTNTPAAVKGSQSDKGDRVGENTQSTII